MFEAAASSALFVSGSWVSFWKEYFLQIIVFKVEEGLCCSKSAYSAELKKDMDILREKQLC
jgi:hypothetical protein